MDLKLKSEPPSLRSIIPGISPLEEETITILGDLERQQSSGLIPNLLELCNTRSNNLLIHHIDLLGNLGRYGVHDLKR
jgi:hypothetical protein